jgi:putative phage-type endonuclease
MNKYEIELIQGSPEWHACRLQHLGASDAAAIMGVSPWSNQLKLWNEKVGLAGPKKETGPMLYGRQEESKALDSFIEETGIIMAPAVRFHHTIDFMMASLDGLSPCETLALEIKCPGKKDHTTASEGNIPDKYYPQLMHQMEVLGIDMIYYYSYNPSSQYLIEVKRDQVYIDDMLEKERKFWDCVLKFEEPE